MILTEFLRPENIRQGVVVSSKKRALEIIGSIIAQDLNAQAHCDNEQGLCPIECFGNLFKREKLGSTSLNNGVALPHAKLPKNDNVPLEKPVAVLLQLESAIDYEANGHKNIDLLYAIMFPEESCQHYKDCLPQIAERLSDKTLVKQLRNAENARQMWQILVEFDRLQTA